MPRDGVGHSLRTSGETGRILVFVRLRLRFFACGILTTLRFSTTKTVSPLPVFKSLQPALF
jgi:hypothetical protein